MSAAAADATALQLNLVQRVNMADALVRTARRVPDREAIVDGEERMTYVELVAAVSRLAHGLLARGYRRHDSLAVLSGNSTEFLITYFACAQIGVVVVPLSLVWRERELSYVLQHSRARGLVVEAQLLDTVAGALEESPDVTDVLVARGTADAGTWESVAARHTPLAAVAEGQSERPAEVYVADRDPLSYMYTSGTTAAPKGVVSSHLALYLGSLTAAHEMRFTSDDRMSGMMPLFHIAQLNAFATPVLMVGGTVVLMRGFNAEILLSTIERERLTFLFALPKMYRELIDHPSIPTRDLSSLRRAGYAMAPLPMNDLLRAMDVLGCEFSLGFGQTEMVPMTTIFQPQQQLSHHGSVGTQVVNVQIEIMGPDGTLLPRGASGEIVYRGPHALQEYLNDESATRASVAHGWFHSGDLGHFDDDGVLWFEDRSKDVIKTGGENVASLEVERAIYESEPRVKEVAVVGLPHPDWVEAVTALVIPHDDALTAQDVSAALASALPAYKRPKSVIVVDDFPRTATGKIQKNVLRQEHAAHYDRETPGAAAHLR
ncbi:MAG TPA: AMP-binding protein [Egibacteraceae bacterium]|nr:AMP-binding protein [Egibacteraceae bacterium]